MDDFHNDDLKRIVLCKHGKTCMYRLRGECGFAHALAELLPPREVVYSYKGVWSDGVDRFVGQHLSQSQINRIQSYCGAERVHDRPVWAKCLAWFFGKKGAKEYPDCPWDFGIWQDLDTVIRSRKIQERPFRYWLRRDDGMGIWTALQARRDAFTQGIPRPPPLPGPAPHGIPETRLATVHESSDSMFEAAESQAG